MDADNAAEIRTAQLQQERKRVDDLTVERDQLRADLTAARAQNAGLVAALRDLVEEADEWIAGNDPKTERIMATARKVLAGTK